MKERRKIFIHCKVIRMCEILNISIRFMIFVSFIVDMSGAIQSIPAHYDNSLPVSLSDAALVCRGMSTRGQRAACARAPDAAVIALQSQRAAITECQHQLRWHRWNCSELETKSNNPYSSAILKRGFRETAFVYALVSAGVAHAVARGCAQGRLLSCGCDPAGYRTATNDLENELKPNIPTYPHNDRTNRKPRRLNSHPRYINTGMDEEKTVDANLGLIKNFDIPDYSDIKSVKKNGDPKSRAARRRAAARWKWGGCSHNLDYGIQFSKMFLDSREKAGDIQSRINLHNNEAGRIALATNMKVRCKCHGMSGSCQLKTCWRAAPELRVVASVLKEKFRSAVMVDPAGLNRGVPALRGRRRGQRRRRARRAPPHALLYYETSPDFCERDPTLDIFGTSGRQCRVGRMQAAGSCGSLCCGRGHDVVRQRRSATCNCSFRWCCHVTCDRCTTEYWLTVCK